MRIFARARSRRETFSCGASAIQEFLLSPLAPTLYTHLLIQMPQTYTVSPGGDTIVAEGYCTVLQSFPISGLLTASCSFGTEGMDKTSVRQICLVNWEKLGVKVELGWCCSTNAAQFSVNGSETRRSAFVNTAFLTFLYKRDPKPLPVTSPRDTWRSCCI